MNNFRLLTLIGAIFFIAVGIRAPLFTLYLEQTLGADYGRISLILSSYVALLLLVNYGWGRFSDWLGRRKPMIVGGLLFLALTNLLLSQVPSANWAWLVYLVEALGVGAYNTLSLALMGDVLDDEAAGNRQDQRGRNMGFYRGLGSLAFAVGAILGGQIADLYNLPSIFIICSGLCLIGGLCATQIQENRDLAPHPEEKAHEPRLALNWRENFAQLPFLFLVGVLFWTMAHSASASMWPNYMSHLGYSKAALSSLWGLAAFIEMPAMYITGALSDTLGRVVMLIGGSLGIAVVNAGYLLFAAIFPILLLIQIIRGFGFGSYTTNAMTLTAELGSQQRRGSRSGLFYMVGGLGQLLGMFLGGRLVQMFSFEFLYGFCAVSALIAGICFWRLHIRPST